MTTSPRFSALALLCTVTVTVTVTVAGSAHAEPTKEECVDAYKKNQQLRREGALRAAIKQLLVCARDPCPAVLQTDCVEWLADANVRLPSIVVKAHSGAVSDLADVSVTMDGVPLAAQLDGRAIEVDSGAHTFVFAHPGAPSIEKKLLVVEGEKARVVDVDFTPGAARPSVGPVPGPASRPVPWTVYALGGVGLAALGVGATFGAIGISGRNDLSTCSGSRCPQDRDAVARKFLVADVSYAVSVVSIVAATIFYLTRPAQRPEAR